MQKLIDGLDLKSFERTNEEIKQLVIIYQAQAELQFNTVVEAKETVTISFRLITDPLQ